MYDFGEKETAKICVVLLQGKLTEDVTLQISTYNGTAIGESYMYMSKILFTKMLNDVGMAKEKMYTMQVVRAGNG